METIYKDTSGCKTYLSCVDGSPHIMDGFLPLEALVTRLQCCEVWANCAECKWLLFLNFQPEWVWCWEGVAVLREGEDGDGEEQQGGQAGQNRHHLEKNCSCCICFLTLVLLVVVDIGSWCFWWLPGLTPPAAWLCWKLLITPSSVYWASKE